MVLRPLADPDVWWHLRTGELITEAGLVDRDPWSHASTEPWLLHEWFSELVMYGVYAVGGYSAVAALRAVLFATLAAVLVACCRRVARPDLATGAAALALIATLPGSAERPQLVSWVLLAALCPWLRACVAERRVPWMLVPLVWLWANLHGLWLLALVLYAALVIGLALDLGWERRRLTAIFALVGVLATGAAMLTPVGPRLLLSPFHVREYARFVTEWAPPSITRPTTACALLLLGVVVIDWARRESKVDAPTISFVAAATVIGMTYSRTVPVLAIAVAPLAAAAIQRWTNRDVPAFELTRGTRRQWMAATLCVVPVVALLLPRAATVDPVRSMPGGSESRMTAAAGELDALPGRAKVLNEYDLGGWVIWSARDVSPAIDGRAEIYPVEYVEGYVGALSMRPGWDRFVEQMDPDAALLYRQTPLVSGLTSQGWRVTSDDGDVLVLVPPRRSDTRTP